MPALPTKVSSCPKAFTAAATALSLAAGLVTSPFTVTTVRRSGSARSFSRCSADPVAELDQIEREYAAVIALLDRSAALRHAAALVPSEVGLDLGFAAERIDDLDTLTVCAVSGNRTDALLDLVIPAGSGLSGKV